MLLYEVEICFMISALLKYVVDSANNEYTDHTLSVGRSGDEMVSIPCKKNEVINI